MYEELIGKRIKLNEGNGKQIQELLFKHRITWCSSGPTMMYGYSGAEIIRISRHGRICLANVSSISLTDRYSDRIITYEQLKNTLEQVITVCDE